MCRWVQTTDKRQCCQWVQTSRSAGAGNSLCVCVLLSTDGVGYSSWSTRFTFTRLRGQSATDTVIYLYTIGASIVSLRRED